MTAICIIDAAPEYIADQDPGDEHAYKPIIQMERCPSCGCNFAPEPTEEEKQRIWDDPDYNWFPPDGEFFHVQYGLMGGGCGLYCLCDRCGFFHKEQDRE